jgi:hypothetical protein
MGRLGLAFQNGDGGFEESEGVGLLTARFWVAWVKAAWMAGWRRQLETVLRWTPAQRAAVMVVPEARSATTFC